MRWLTRLSFVFYFLAFAAGITTLCYCPCFYYAAAAASVVPIILGPRRLHRFVGVLLLVMALATAKDTARLKAEEDAKVDRVRANAARLAATSPAAATAPSP